MVLYPPRLLRGSPCVLGAVLQSFLLHARVTMSAYYFLSDFFGKIPFIITEKVCFLVLRSCFVLFLYLSNIAGSFFIWESILLY